MYKPGRAVIFLICTVLMLMVGCEGEKRSAEPEATPKRWGRKAQVVAPEKKSIKGTEIGGQISEDTILRLEDSPYILSRNLEVMPDVKLTIEPGVVIKAKAYTAIVIRGNFHAIGSAEKHIKFTSLNKDERWDGIQFKDESFDYNSDEVIEGHGCTIQYCEIENANTGIYCEKASPQITNNIIQNSGEGIKCRDWANPKISKNLIKDNDDGIVCAEYSSPQITYNTIMGDEGKGISCVNHCSPEIAYNTIFGKGDTWWAGILCENGSAPKINNNNIYSNGGYNLKQSQQRPVDISPEIDARNNWWGVADKDAVAATIFDKADKASLGEVTFVPFMNSKIRDANHLN